MKQTLSFIKRHYQSLICFTFGFFYGNGFELIMAFLILLKEIDNHFLHKMNKALEENLNHWHTRYTKIYHEIIGKHEM